MSELLTFGLGLVIGAIGATIYLGNQIQELKTIILDKRTIINLLKQATKEMNNSRKKSYKRNGYKTRMKSKVSVNKTAKAWYLYYITIGTAGQSVIC